jgi:hypothetical protein
MTAQPGGADETIITQIVVETDQALIQAKAFREQVDALKQRLQELAKQSGQSFKDIAEGMKRARTAELTDAFGKVDTKGVQQFNKALTVALRESEKAAKDLDKELKQKPKDTKAAGSAFGQLGDAAKYVFGTIFGITAITAIRDLIQAMGELITEGYELSKSIYRAGVAIQSLQFRGVNASAEQTVEWVKELREQFGTLSEREAVDVVATTQLLTRNLGFTEKQIKDVIDISTALAIVQGKDVAESARQLVLFFSSGYGEGLQKAGIAVNRFTVAQEAMRMGFGKSYMALTEQQRAQAAYSLVMKQTGEIVKAAGEYQETAAGQIDTLTKAIETQKARIGTELLPLKAEWLTMLVGLIDKFKQVTLWIDKTSLAAMEFGRNNPLALDRSDEALALLDERIAALKKRIQQQELGDALESELDQATEASEKAAAAFQKFSDPLNREIILKFGTEQAQQQIADLERQIAEFEARGLDLNVEANAKKLEDLQNQLAAARENALKGLAPGDSLRVITEYEQKLKDIEAEIQRIQALKEQRPLTLAEVTELTELINESKLLNQWWDRFVERYKDIERIEGISSATDQIVKFRKEIEELQTQRAAMIEVGGDVSGLDDAIAEVERNIDSIQVQLAEKLGVPQSVIQSWVDLLQAQDLDLSDQIGELQDLQEQLKELQRYRDTVLMLDVNADTSEIDARIAQKVAEIEALEATLSVRLGLDASEINQFLAIIALDVQEMAREVVGEWEEYSEEVVDINQDMADDIAKINDDLAADIAKATRDLQNDIADAQRDEQEKLADAARKYREQEWKAERDYQEKMRRLREEYLFDLEDALRERDALQVLRLMRRYELDKEQTTRSYEMDKEERARAYQQEIADIRRQTQLRIEELKREYAQRIAEMKAEAEQEIRERQAQAEKEKQDALAKYKEALQARLDELALRLMDEYGLTVDQTESVLALLKDYFGVGGKSQVIWSEYASMMSTAIQAGIDKLNLYLEIERQIVALAPYMAPPVGAGGPSYESTPTASGGYRGLDGLQTITVGETGPEFVLSSATTKALEAALGGSLTQGNILAAATGANGEQRMRLEVWLSPDLEGRIVDEALGQSAAIMEQAYQRR